MHLSISRFRKASIKTKVTMAVLVTVSLLMMALSWNLYLYVQSMMSRNIMTQQSTLVTEIADQLNGRVELARHQLTLAATEINSQSLTDIKKLQNILTQASPIQMIFDAGLLVIGPDGRVITESMGFPELIGADLHFREYVSVPLRTGQLFISAPFRLSVPPHSPLIAMAVPVRDNSDRIICLLTGYHSLGADQFLTSLSSKRFGSGGYLYLMHGRTIMMHPDSARIMENVPQGKNLGLDKALRGFEGSLDNYNSKGQHVLSSFKRVGETGWILVANTPYEEAFRPLNQLAVNAALISALGILLSLMVVWLVTRRLTRPILHVIDHIDGTASAGSDWKPLEVRTGDEIERLATTFNTMMTEVRTARQTLAEEKEFYSGIIQHTAAPMFVIDSNHTILFWNSALAKLTGKSSFQMKNTKQQWTPFYASKRSCLADLVIDSKLELIEEYYSNFESSMFVDGAYRAEGWFDDIGGQRRYLSFSAAPILNSRNEIVAAVETLEDITERKLAQEAMASHNLFLQEILDAIPTPVFYKDANSVYIGCNKSFQTFVGRTLKDVVGKTISDIMPAQYAEKTEQHDQEVIKERAGFSYESELMRCDGQERTVLITKAPFFTSSGELGGIVGAYVDITAQRRMDEKIRKMSRALEQSPVTIVITDPDGVIEYVNPKFCQTSGYSAEEAIGRNPRVLKTGEIPVDGYAELWKTISSGNEWHGEFHNKRKDGTLYWEFASISPLFDKDGCITGYLAVKEDITGRKTVETELADSRRELEFKHVELEQLFGQVEHAKQEWEQTLDHLRDFVILTDAGHRIRRYNKLLSDITGKPINELVGADWQELINEAGFTFVTFNGTSGEIFHRRSGRSYDITIYPVEDNGVVTGHVVSINDTTELRATTQELEKAYAELKEAQLQIFQQEKMASIGQLAAGVAHEINNPMGFISSNLGTLNKYIDRLAEFIAAGDKSLTTYADSEAADQINDLRKRLKIDYIMEDARQLIDESQDGAGRVRRIVQDLKSFSRVDQAECALINLNESLETTINIAWNEIKYVATLNREFGDIPEILCFPQQLNQVFLNLLVNAAHALGERQGTITIRTWGEGTDVLVSVTDTGCGIPEEIRKRIFEPFFTTKEVGKGTGLGLSISYEIIRKHGGEIQVESEVGSGTTFTVRLPVKGPDVAGTTSPLEQEFTGSGA